MNPKVRVALRFVEDNLHRDIYVAEVAKLVRLSHSRFCHPFKSETGISFGQYVKERRMETARQLLETTFEPVKVIAYEVGYHNPAYFEREFRKTCGITPSEYRAQHIESVSICAGKRVIERANIL